MSVVGSACTDVQANFQGHTYPQARMLNLGKRGNSPHGGQFTFDGEAGPAGAAQGITEVGTARFELATPRSQSECATNCATSRNELDDSNVSGFYTFCKFYASFSLRNKLLSEEICPVLYDGGNTRSTFPNTTLTCNVSFDSL